MSPTNFCATSYHFKYIKIKNIWLQKVGQGHRAQFSQLHHSMANIKIYKYLPQILALALTVSQILIN